MSQNSRSASAYPARILVCAIFLASIVLPPSLVHAELVDKIVAVVNDEVITLSDVDAEGQEVFRKITATSPVGEVQEKLEMARAEILNTIIDKRLIAQKASALNITVSESEVEAAYNNVLQRNRISREQLLAKLESNGLSEAVYKTTLESQLLQNKLVGTDVHAKIVVTDDMIQKHYDENYTSNIEDGAYYLLQMGFAWQDSEATKTSPAIQSANKLEAKKRAERIHNLVMSGQNFETLASKYSDLPSKVDGGDIGTFQLDEMAEYMRDAVSSLKSGEVSEIIETPAGYQFFKLLSAGEDAVIRKAAYVSVKDEIKEKLYDEELQKAYGQWVKDLKEKAYIQKL